jgi:uncharacterized membrane-anchored protein
MKLHSATGISAYKGDFKAVTRHNRRHPQRRKILIGRWMDGRRWLHGAMLLMGLLWATLALAAMTPEEISKIREDADKAAKAGPVEIALAGQGVLKLPAGHVFVPQPHATRVLQAMGNPGEDSSVQGLIFPSSETVDWVMVLRFESSGYIKDDDAREWDAAKLLQSLRDGTAEANKEREQMGVSGVEITGWAEPLVYDATTHRLVWALASHEMGAPAEAPQGVNYNTYVLGREGYFSLNLITDLKSLPTHKASVQQMLAALDFDAGKRYADFNVSTDKVAEYGLAALVVGLAAKKLGFLAMIFVFLAKFGKIILLGSAGAIAVFMRFFGRKTPPQQPPSA